MKKDIDLEIRLRTIEVQIEKIKDALLGFRPEFKYDFCDHEPEKINFQQEFEGKSTSGMKYDPHYRCKKCGLIVDESGNSIIQRA